MPNSTNWNHPEIEQNQKTFLSQQANSGESTLTVINTKGFTTNQLVLAGLKGGSEEVEVVKTHATTAPTNTVITLATALKFSHSNDTPVCVLDYDQIEIYRAASKGGSYSLIATIDITYEEEDTAYWDGTGSATDYYKIRYKNSISAAVSGYSVEIPATGLADDTLAGMVDSVMELFSEQSEQILLRRRIIKWLNDGYKKLIKAIIDLGVDYYVKYGTDDNGALISFVANQRAYNCPADFIKPRRFLFTYDGTNYNPADPIDRSKDHPNNVYLKTKPVYYFEGKKIIPLPKPTSSQGGILPIYSYLPARLTNDDDVPDLPIGYTESPVNYALKRAFESDNKYDTAKYYEDLFDKDKGEMLSEIEERTPEMPKYVDAFGISAENDMYDGFQIPE